MNTTEPGDVDHVSPEMRMTMQAVYCLISIVGVLGNSLTIASVLINKKLKSIPNVYICNLAVADLIVCGAICPFSAWVFTQEPGDVGWECQFIGALNAALLGKTIYGLTAIAVNRYILLVKGSNMYTRFYTRRNVAISVIVLWILPVLIILPALLGFGSFGYNAKMGSCIMLSYDTETYIFVQVFLHGVCVGPCVLITAFCYIRIIFHFRNTQRRLRKSMHAVKTNHSKTSAEYTDENLKIEELELSSSGPSNNNISGDQTHAKRSRASRRVVMNLCTVFMVFILCWSPIVGVYTIDFYNQIPATVYHIFLVIAVLNSSLNVFIYAGMNRAFRKSYHEIITCKFTRLKSSL